MSFPSRLGRVGWCVTGLFWTPVFAGVTGSGGHSRRACARRCHSGFAAGRMDADTENIRKQSDRMPRAARKSCSACACAVGSQQNMNVALHLAGWCGAKQCTQSFAVGGEPDTRRRLPLAVGQRALRNDARRAADGPRAQHFDHLHEQLAAAG